MTQEEKAKAYDKVREKIAIRFGSNVAEEIFSQYEESEDESIRKAIHIYLEWLDGRKDYAPKGEYSIRDMIAWLEKQGEQKPAENKGMNLVEEEMTPFQKKVFCIIDTTIEEEQGLKQVCDELFALASNEIKQNPAWSEEDEVMIKVFDSIIRYIVEVVDKNVLERFGTKSEELFSWLKSIKERVQTQPKQEWSEEDYNEIETIACHLDNIDNEGMAEVLRNIRDKYYSQSNWKPSDEQMEALRKAEATIGVNHVVLAGLISDLEKLKG